jgi:polar amino acid transport system substrate-binding protein
MAWTRRRFLSMTTMLGAAATVGCSSRVGGEPRPDPAAHVAEDTSTSPSSPGLDSVTVGLLQYTVQQPQSSDEPTGPTPDVAKQVLNGLGISNIKFVIVSEETQLIAAMASGQMNVAGGLTIRKDLCDSLKFSVPDWVSGTALMVAKGNPKGLKNWADIKAKGATVAVMQNLPENADAAAAGVPAGKIKVLPDPTIMMTAVQQGQVDCAAFDDLSAHAVVKSSNGAVIATKPFAPPKRLPLIGAYAFPASDDELLDSFNNRLRDLHESGDWMSIVAPYGYTEDNAPPPDLTTEKACTSG